ncbi:MAG: M48 family metalloprotease [Geitlerinemataceae cyanobacterium]
MATPPSSDRNDRPTDPDAERAARDTRDRQRAGFVPLETDGTEPNAPTKPKRARAIVTPPTESGEAGSTKPDNPFDADAFAIGTPATHPPAEPIRSAKPAKPAKPAPRLPNKPSGRATQTAARRPLPPRPKSPRPKSLAPQPPKLPKPHAPTVPASAELPAEPTAEPATKTDSGTFWRNAGRPERWQRLKPLDAGHLRRREILATGAIFAVLTIGLHWLMAQANDFLLTIGLRPVQAFYLRHDLKIALFLVAIAIAAPFALDKLLEWQYRAKPLTQSRLKKISPEAARLISQFARAKGAAKPQLVTIDAPAAFVWAYGYGRKSLRLAISTGAIEGLAADELAADIAAGLGAGARKDVFFATASAMLLQVFYCVYDGLSVLGDRCEAIATVRKPDALAFSLESAIYLAAGFTLWLTSTFATLAYGVYRLLNLPVLYWSRLRQTYADRFSANLTGNPNARARSLVKQAMSMRAAFECGECGNARALPRLLERFVSLGGIDPLHGVWFGRYADRTSVLAALRWEASGSYGIWLSIASAHPPLGQRLARLVALAERAGAAPEFTAEELIAQSDNRRLRSPKRVLPISPASLLASTTLMHNLAPFLGVSVALGLVAIAASVGTIGRLFELRSLSWLQADWPWLTLGLTLVGFAVGTLLRVNAFFPNFKPYALNTEPDLDRWTFDLDSLPIDSRTLRLTGTLVGRRGVANWFGQDLWLDDGQRLWPLHVLDRTGWLGWLVPTYDRAVDAIGQTVTVTGWFRRGFAPWIDVDRLEVGTPADGAPQADASAQNGHPIWSTTIAVLCAFWGAIAIARGGL